MEPAVVDGADLIFPCPHCGLMIVVARRDLRCRIFRHGVGRDQAALPPHSSREVCERLAGDMYGCTGPFRLVERGGRWYPEVCDYI
jgi:hypothetical protein